MDNSEYRGALLKEFPPVMDSKFSRIYFKYLALWCSIPELLLIGFFYSRGFFSEEPSTIWMAVFLLAMVVTGYFVVQNALMRSHSPLYIYSNGVAARPSSLDRLRRRSGFIRKDEIVNATFREVVRTERGKVVYQGVEGQLNLRDGKKWLLPSHSMQDGPAFMREFKDASGIEVEYISQTGERTVPGRAHKVIVPAEVPSAPAAVSNFCIYCGGSLAADDSFCTSCGKSVIR